MLTFASMLLAAAAAAVANTMDGMDPAADQLVIFKKNQVGPIGIMRTSAGTPVSYIKASVSLNTRLLDNEYLIESITHFNRERIPERVVHAKGGGAFGYFKVTGDISDICKAEVFNKIGKETPVAVRFSSVSPESGGSDVSRDARGFAVKFYTQDGNFDIVGLSTPIFITKDPLKFGNFIHVLKRNPSTNLKDLKAFWDMITLNPDSMHLFLMLYGDRGIPASYINMPGYSIHTYPVINAQHTLHFIRFHIIPDAGIKYLLDDEACAIAGKDLDYFNRNLYNAIGNGEYPSWTVSVQVLTANDVNKSMYDVFDATRVIPLDKYPLKEVGKIILDRNPKNYFAEIEQLAFCPGNLVPGIYGDPGALFEARRFSYRDAQNYRLGANFNKITVNCPFRTETFTYNRDGAAPVKDNGNGAPNYYPNSFNGPVPFMVQKPLFDIIENPEPNNFDQATEFYVNEMTTDERRRFITYVISSLKQATHASQKRAIVIFYKIHEDLGRRIEQVLKANMTLLSNKF